MERLQHLLDEGIIDEVFQQLKTGKEAEVWLVSHRGEPVAAKLYKEREFRSFKNDSGYLEGRQVRNTRTQRAMDKGTAFGRRAAEEAWKSSEANALYALHAAGVRVPRPVLFYEGVLLMEVIGDAEGRVAPRLVEAGVTREQALGLYTRLRGEVVKMLSADLIHGDLSEFNILLGVDGPVIIDFPQVVEAARNSRSEHFFRRDLGNLVRFFSGIDPDLARHQGDADEIWRAYTRRELSADFVPTGRSAARPPQHHRQGGAAVVGRPDAPPGRREERRGPPPWKQGREGPKQREQRGPGGPQVSFKGQPPPQAGDPGGSAERERRGPPPWKQGREPRGAGGQLNGQAPAPAPGTSGQAEHRPPPWKQQREPRGRGGQRSPFNGQGPAPGASGEAEHRPPPSKQGRDPRGGGGQRGGPFNGQGPGPGTGASGQAEHRPPPSKQGRDPHGTDQSPTHTASTGNQVHRGPPPWKQAREPRGQGADRGPSGGRDSRRRRPRRW